MSWPGGNFFQSRAFGEFCEMLPYRGKSWFLIVQKNQNIQATCLVIKVKLPFGFSWLWGPYGPLGTSEEIFEDLARIGQEERAIFARIEPPLGQLTAFGKKMPHCKKWWVSPSKNRFTPEHTLLLDTEKSASEILAQMKPKGRYNIQVAKKRGVEVHFFENFHDIPKKDFDIFYELLKKTSQRDAFGIHPKFFYENILKILSQYNLGGLFLAYIKGKPIAGIIVVFYKNTATYYYGASDYEYRNSMAPYLLQWEAILEAKKRGMRYYDFLGIAPGDEKNHPWKGVTEFKKKFGGREFSYPPAFDIIYKPFWYCIYRLRNLW